MMYAHECDLMCMCRVQYHMPPVCLELLITTVSLWICSIQEVVPPETMLQTVYPKSLQMQRSKLNICVGNKPLQNPTFAFSFFFSCSKKKGVTKSIQEHQRLGVVSSSQPLLLWHLVIITAWVWRQRSCTACERFCYRFFSCKTDCEEMAGKLRIITNLWNLWKEGSETLLHVHFEAVRISLLLQKTFPLLGQLYTLYYISTESTDNRKSKKVKWTTPSLILLWNFPQDPAFLLLRTLIVITASTKEVLKNPSILWQKNARATSL